MTSVRKDGCGCECHGTSDLNGLRTPEQWGEHYGIEVRDPDGWRGPNDPPWDRPITLADYYRRAGESTTSGLTSDAWDRMNRDLKEEHDRQPDVRLVWRPCQDSA